MIQEELRAIVVAAGLTPSKTTYNQVLTAINVLMRIAASTLATDSGSANAYVLTTSPSFSSVSVGQKLRFTATNGNTGACTVNVNGIGVLPLRGQNNSALQGGEIVVNGYYEIEYISANVWCITSQAGFNASMQVANGSQPLHACAFGQAFGVGQTVTNVTGSRALGTGYTNTSSKAIMVTIQATSSTAPADLLFTVNGVSVSSSDATVVGRPMYCTFIVPPGGTYSANVTSGTGTIGIWVELR